MLQSRVLLIASGEHPPSLSSLLESEQEHGFQIEVMAAVQEAVVRIADMGFDAVVVWAEREDELNGVLRIRKAGPDLPLLLVTSRRDPGFGGLARENGITSILHPNHDLSLVVETVRLAVISRKLAEDLTLQSDRARSQVQEVSELARENRELLQSVSNQVGRKTKGLFVPLLVEDDLDHALLMVRAFARADVFTPLPILKSGEEAIDFLSERLKHRRPDWPSLLILDIALPRKSGFEVLEWIRKQPELRRLPVVMLTSTVNPDHVTKAYRLGANSYVIKPTEFNDLVELVANLKRYWGKANQSWESL